LTDTIREFSVHGRHLDRHHARVVSELSFEAAAVAYVEDIAPGEGVAVSVIVRDLATGHERCFRIDLETGETAACA
jgi:hypothetical protein